MSAQKSALIVIDLQNDYFPGGKFPLWNAEATLVQVESAIAKAKSSGIPVILVQHVGKAGASFFAPGTAGVEIHPAISAAAPDAQVVVKAFADGFHQTALAATLAALGVEKLLICGMMTQNCVTHTAISKSAEKYEVAILSDDCTTVSEAIHAFALNAVSTRLALMSVEEAFAR